MSFGDKIRERREWLKMTQEDLSSFVSVDLSRQSVSKWERGETYPDVGNLLTLSAVLGLSLDEMFSEELVKSREEAKEIFGDRIGSKKPPRIEREQEVRNPVVVSNKVPFISKLQDGGIVQIDSIEVVKKEDQRNRLTRYEITIEGVVIEQTAKGRILDIEYKIVDADGTVIDHNWITTNASRKGEQFKAHRVNISRIDWGDLIRVDILGK